jgi:hypothetical protein
MHGDFSRVTFDPARHFSAVLAQQGRVQLDSELNEAACLMLHYLRQLAADLIGPAGVPLDPRVQGDKGGFLIDPVSGSSPPDVSISPGRMYVDGIMLQNEPLDRGASPTYWTQPDGFLDQDVSTDQLPSAPFLVYVRVWEQLITAAEDPGIREIALGDFGPDTSGRCRVVWQVAARASGSGDATAAWQNWLNALYFPKARLKARATRPDDADTNVCDVAPDARYRGPENQLYRVEVHNDGLPGARTAKAPRGTFKWSRENGSVACSVDSVSGADVTVASLGRDGKLGLEVGDWVELVDQAYAARLADDGPQRPVPPLNRVVAVDVENRLVTLDGPPGGSIWPGLGTDSSRRPLLRRWDHRSTSSDSGDLKVTADGALPIVPGTWIDLEDGVQVLFQPDPVQARLPFKYRRGDYWLIPARTIPGDVLWPQDANGPAARTPDGVQYHYAPLASLPTAGERTDLRKTFNALTAGVEALAAGPHAAAATAMNEESPADAAPGPTARAKDTKPGKRAAQKKT